MPGNASGGGRVEERTAEEHNGGPRPALRPGPKATTMQLWVKLMQGGSNEKRHQSAWAAVGDRLPPRWRERNLS